MLFPHTLIRCQNLAFSWGMVWWLQHHLTPTADPLSQSKKPTTQITKKKKKRKEQKSHLIVTSWLVGLVHTNFSVVSRKFVISKWHQAEKWLEMYMKLEDKNKKAFQKQCVVKNHSDCWFLWPLIDYVRQLAVSIILIKGEVVLDDTKRIVVSVQYMLPW